MSEIFPYLFLGGHVEASNYKWLLDNRIDTIINVSIELQNIKYPQIDNEWILRIPIYDTPSQEITEYLDTVHYFILMCKSLGRRILIHCVMGVSRSTSFVVYHIMKTAKVDYQTALDRIRLLRSVVRPNHGFAQTLKSLK